MQQKETIQYFSVKDILITDPAEAYQFPGHWHDAAEFTLALKDNCEYRVGETRYTLMQGDILLVWPGELHETLHVPDHSNFFIQFSQVLLESNRDLAASMRILRQLHRISRQDYPELAADISERMQEMRRSYKSTEVFRETRCKLCISQILLSLGEHAWKTKIRQMEAEGFTTESWERIREACAYIIDHHVEEISQQEVAAAVGLSPCYFSRLFKKYTQLSFPRYVASLRIQTAIRLLGEGSLSITDCAYQAGFQSITAFNRIFLETMGSSPREYRRLYQNETAGERT